MNENKTSRRTSVRYGAVSAATTIVVIAIIIILNLIVGRLPSNILQVDISNQKLYSISDSTREYVSSLDADIEFILLSELGTTDERITKFVNNYASLSDRITVSTIDPILYPSILDTYSTEVNHLIVKNSATGKFRAVPFTGTENALILYALDWSTYEYYENGFDADGQITSAIAFVENETTGSAYFLTGHGEAELGETCHDIIVKSNVILSDTPVELLIDGGIPSDCDLLIINTPTSDITLDEKAMLTEYLENGGDVFIILDMTDAENLNALLHDYGMDMQPGFLGDETRYYQQYSNFYGFYCIAPILADYNDITRFIDTNAFAIYPHAMLLTDPVRETISTFKFLSSSENGVLYDGNNASEKAEYIIAAIAREETDNGEARLTVVACPSLFSEEIVSSMPSMANTTIFANIITLGFDGLTNIIIPAKSLDIEQNTINSYQWWSLLYIGVIPICVFIGGLLYWMKRRKR